MTFKWWLPYFLVVLAAGVLLSCRTEEGSAPKQVHQNFPIISRGKPVDLSSHVHPGRVTVFDFFAEWCPPCRELEHSLKAMQSTYGTRLAIFKLDLVDFDSELARAFAIRDLPFLIVYNERQELLEQGPSAEVLPQLIDYLNR